MKQTGKHAHATPPSILDSRCAVAHPPARQQSRSVLLRGGGLPVLSALVAAQRRALWVRDPRVRADDESSASNDDPEAAGQRLEAHAVIGAALRAIREPSPSPQRHLVGGAVQGEPCGGREPSVDLLPIYRAQPGAGGCGQASGGLFLVELPASRAGHRRPRRYGASAIQGAWRNACGTRRGLPCFIANGAG